MVEHAVKVSRATQLTAREGYGTLVPALCGCRACRMVQMIAAPALGRCNRCGDELTVLSSAKVRGGPLEVLGAPER